MFKYLHVNGLLQKSLNIRFLIIYAHISSLTSTTNDKCWFLDYVVIHVCWNRSTLNWNRNPINYWFKSTLFKYLHVNGLLEKSLNTRFLVISAHKSSLTPTTTWQLLILRSCSYTCLLKLSNYLTQLQRRKSRGVKSDDLVHPIDFINTCLIHVQYNSREQTLLDTATLLLYLILVLFTYSMTHVTKFILTHNNTFLVFVLRSVIGLYERHQGRGSRDVVKNKF